MGSSSLINSIIRWIIALLLTWLYFIIIRYLLFYPFVFIVSLASSLSFFFYLILMGIILGILFKVMYYISLFALLATTSIVEQKRAFTKVISFLYGIVIIGNLIWFWKYARITSMITYPYFKYNCIIYTLYLLSLLYVIRPVFNGELAFNKSLDDGLYGNRFRF